MSVIYYEDEKFLRIYKTLELLKMGKINMYDPNVNLNYIFRDHDIKEIVQQFQDANRIAFRGRYTESVTLENLDYDPTKIKNIKPYGNIYQFLKSLQAVEYNSIEAGDHAVVFINKIIHTIEYHLVSRMEKFKDCEGWME